MWILKGTDKTTNKETKLSFNTTEALGKFLYNNPKTMTITWTLEYAEVARADVRYM